MSTKKKMVAVIGGGASGIVATKILKEYGHDVTCFEKDSSFGGLWNFTADMKNVSYKEWNNQKHGIKSSYSTLVMNSSAITSSYSDFPYSGDELMLGHKDVLQYLREYAEHFSILDDLQFDSRVENVYKQGNKWNVTYNVTSKDGSNLTAQYDNVVIATGPFRFPRIPDTIKDLESFNGTVIHSSQVCNEDLLFRGKNVVIAGDSFSGIDLTCAALNAGCNKVYLSLREHKNAQEQHLEAKREFYCHTLYPDPKQSGRKLPLDYFVLNHHYRNSDKRPLLDKKLLSDIKPLRNSSPDNQVYRYPNDTLVPTLHADMLSAKQRENAFEIVAEMTEHDAVTGDLILKDGVRLRGIEVIVFATGFHCRFPVLEDVWPRECQEKCEFYLHTIPTEKQLDGSGFLYSAVTMSQGTMPVMEMQMRYLCEKVFSREYNEDGLIFSDTERQHMRDLIVKDTEYKAQFDRPYHFYVDVPKLMLTIAQDIGCDPPDHKMFLKPGNSLDDVKLGVAMEHGPLVPAHYRLRGPNSWSGAQEYIVRNAEAVLGTYFDELINHYLTKEDL